VGAIRSVLDETRSDPGDIAAVGLTGQMHGLVLLDDSGAVIRPAILWNDQRTGAECDVMRERVGRDRLIAITGNDALTGFTAPKLLWVAGHEPDNWARARTALLPKDYLRHRLTGEAAADAADGSGTILFDLGARSWSPEILALLDLDPAMFPPVFEGPEVTGVISEAAASATGLAAGTPVVAGGGDQSANAVGVGAINPGVVALSVGTSGVVFSSADRPAIEPEGRVHAFCHAVPSRWHMMGVMLSAAGSLRWLRDTVAPDRSFDDLVALAADVPPGSDGLLFLPYLSGERTPHPDPKARGAFVGLTVRHGLGHLVRSVLEGVAFGLKDGLDLMVAAGVGHPDEVRGSGGGTKSPLWRQILADVLGAGIQTTRTEEGAAYGAGLLATVASGWFETVDEACAALVEVTPGEEPSADRALYEEAHLRYQALYPALKPGFDAIAG
jgi:xylulokinase